MRSMFSKIICFCRTHNFTFHVDVYNTQTQIIRDGVSCKSRMFIKPQTPTKIPLSFLDVFCLKHSYAVIVSFQKCSKNESKTTQYERERERERPEIAVKSILNENTK